MVTNKHWNEKLKFSWTHIVAFVALIFISYTTFVGLTYLTKGDFKMAGALTVLIVLLLLALFLAVQQLKGCDGRYAKRIIWERILFWASPVLFVALMIPYAHTWTVQRNNDEIVKQFSESINSSKQMFIDYEAYGEERIQSASLYMDDIILNMDSLEDEYYECGFIPGLESMQKENRIYALRIQLMSCDYDSLKVMATKWIDGANQGANVWNVFLLGNIEEIKSAITIWHSQLVSFSSTTYLGDTIQTMEDGRVLMQGGMVPFDNDGESIKNALDGLSSLSNLFTERGWPSLWGWLTGILCYVMLLYPWYTQDRNSNNPYKLIGYQSWKKQDSNPIISTGI